MSICYLYVFDKICIHTFFLQHEYRPESIPRNEKNENEMTINLLQDNQESTKNKISETHKQLKYVHTRKVTIASGPRTMLARRPRHVGKVNCSFYSVINQIIVSNDNNLKYDCILFVELLVINL